MNLLIFLLYTIQSFKNQVQGPMKDKLNGRRTHTMWFRVLSFLRYILINKNNFTIIPHTLHYVIDYE